MVQPGVQKIHGAWTAVRSVSKRQFIFHANTVLVRDTVRIMRELQELSQNELAARTGIPQPTLSAIENDRVDLGVERATVLARAACKLPFFNWPRSISSRPSVWRGQ